MTDYQIEMTITTYFDVLIEKGIPENKVKDFGQEKGILYIVLEDGKTINQKIKNFYN